MAIFPDFTPVVFAPTRFAPVRLVYARFDPRKSAPLKTTYGPIMHPYPASVLYTKRYGAGNVGSCNEKSPP